MQVRLLKPNEYELLKQAPDKFVPDPRLSLVVAATSGDKLIGRICVLPVCHVEGAWIKRKHRGNTIGFRMHKKLSEEASRLWNLGKLIAFAVDSEMEDYLNRLGYKKSPMTVWEKEI